MEVGPEAFTEMIGQDLSGVTFVRDYLQLQFSPSPLLNVYTPTTVRYGVIEATFGDPAFANLLIGQIGKIVTSVELATEAFLRIRFTDESTITVSLRPEDYVAPEAINLFCKDNRFIVI